MCLGLGVVFKGVGFSLGFLVARGAKLPKGQCSYIVQDLVFRVGFKVWGHMLSDYIQCRCGIQNSRNPEP